ncbi:MAG: DNA mismatch repair endonuclease MutL, partial [Bacteroidaceae bacterium]|nr:DNA mismatch repair endonuclease MutL [Bacteroidaceae bacterium]
MDIIHLLPDSVANQIAAGEVVQRPSSVIKELMENAVDAGATNIDVVVVDAGRTSIQVIDDGKGMSETDARLAFERHATSKIRQAEDLFTLCTMGFRGEALPSIAAVAQVHLLTRTADREWGTSLTIEGSQIVEQEPCSCPVGANFQVNNLFFNVPARRKFLKSNQTELNNLIQEFERIALVNPSVSFSLTSNNTLISKLTTGSLRQRVVSIFGKKLNEQLLSVETESTLVNIVGFVGKPSSSRKKGANQYLFVNGRYMRHPYFHRAVMEAFAHLIPEGEQVPYFLYFTVDPANIDVNIHPTKTEIKFENETAIWQIIVAAIRDTLGRFNAVPPMDFGAEERPDIPVYNPHTFNGTMPKAPSVQVNTNYNPFKKDGASQRPPVHWDELYNGIEKADFIPTIEPE